MNIKTPEFQRLLNDYAYEASCNQPDDAKLTKATGDLFAHIDTYVVSERAKAVNEFKAQCRAQRLLLVKGEGFEQLLNNLDALPDGDMAEHARNLKTDGLTAPEPDTSPEFTINEDADLDRLLNSTAALLSGHANHDVGMMWYDDLQVVLGKIKMHSWREATELPEDNTPVLAELKVSSRKKQRAFAVVSYFRTEPGVHDEAPGWFDEDGTERQVLRWQKITMQKAVSTGDAP